MTTKTKAQLEAEEYMVEDAVEEVPEKGNHYGGLGIEDFKQAEWLAQRFRKEWRYDYSTEKWHHFDGTRWVPDQSQQLLRAVADLVGTTIKRGKHTGDGELRRLFALLNLAPQKRAVEALATLDGYGTEGSDWDQDPFLLGCPNGIVDLRTGDVREGRPEDLVTKTTGIVYDPDAEAPVFGEFLRQVTADHTGADRLDLAGYLLLVFGAALLGHTQPQQYWLLYGQPGAGKGALCRTIAHVFGTGPDGYAWDADSNLYSKPKQVRDSAAPRADLVSLKGKRLVYVHEPGSPFDDDMLKKHTGGDRITARSLHSNVMLSWLPTHTLMFSSNRLPAIEDVGAMRRRARVAPFVRNFEDHVDATLEDRMRAEGPGILATLVRLAVAYNADPSVLLDPKRLPPVVSEESKQYIEENDPLAQWAAERALFGKARKAELQDLVEDYAGWASRPQNSEAPGFTVRTMPTALVKFKGVSKRKSNGRVMFDGIGLRYLAADDGPEPAQTDAETATSEESQTGS